MPPPRLLRFRHAHCLISRSLLSAIYAIRLVCHAPPPPPPPMLCFHYFHLFRFLMMLLERAYAHCFAAAFSDIFDATPPPPPAAADAAAAASAAAAEFSRAAPQRGVAATPRFRHAFLLCFEIIIFFATSRRAWLFTLPFRLPPPPVAADDTLMPERPPPPCRATPSAAADADVTALMPLMSPARRRQRRDYAADAAAAAGFTPLMPRRRRLLTPFTRCHAIACYALLRQGCRCHCYIYAAACRS